MTGEHRVCRLVRHARICGHIQVVNNTGYNYTSVRNSGGRCGTGRRTLTPGPPLQDSDGHPIPARPGPAGPSWPRRGGWRASSHPTRPVEVDPATHVLRDPQAPGRGHVGHAVHAALAVQGEEQPEHPGPHGYSIERRGWIESATTTGCASTTRSAWPGDRDSAARVGVGGGEPAQVRPPKPCLGLEMSSSRSAKAWWSRWFMTAGWARPTR